MAGLMPLKSTGVDQFRFQIFQILIV